MDELEETMWESFDDVLEECTNRFIYTNGDEEEFLSTINNVSTSRGHSSIRVEMILRLATAYSEIRAKILSQES